MRFLDNLTVSRKLWGVTLLIIIGMAIVAVLTQRGITRELEQAMDDVQAYESRIVDATQWRGMSEATFQRVLATTLIDDATITRTFAPGVKDGIAAISVLQKKIVAQARSDADRHALDTIGARRAIVLEQTKRVTQMRQSGGTAGVQAFLDKEMMPAVDAYLGALADYVRLQEAQREAAKNSADVARKRLAWLGMLGVAAVAALGLTLAALLVRSICRPLADAVELARAIGAGDLTHDADSPRGDELGELTRAMGAMARQLRSVVAQVRSGVEAVGTASSQIATGSIELSQRTEEQASNLQQTAASMEELTATVRQNADNARAAAQLAAGASEVAARGGKVVSEVVVTMDQITGGARKIADIINVIDGIAFQTNILALNAAVEAARAGAQGRGFAVVAGEVRALAQRSAQAAKEIKGLIEQSVCSVDDGARLVAQAGTTMHDIVAQVRRVNDLIGEITSASNEQSRGIEQVGQAVAQLDQVTQQNAALVEESAAAAESMKHQAVQLSETVALFDVG